MRYKAARWFLLSLITISIIFSLKSFTSAQTPLLPTPTNQNKTDSSPWWDLNRSFPCSQFWCSEVHIYGNWDASGELKVAIEPKLEQSVEMTRLEVEARARLIQNNFQNTLKEIISSQPSNAFLIPKKWSFWWPRNINKPIHPLTPTLDVGFKNGQTVVYIPQQTNLNLSQQDVVTVTEIDAKANVITLDELALSWKSTIQNSISQALWGHTFDVNYPGLRLVIVVLMAMVTLAGIWLMQLWKILLKSWERKLAIKQKKLIESLRSDSEDSILNEAKIPVSSQPNQPLNTPQPWQAIAENISTLTSPIHTLREHTIITQQKNIVQLLWRLAFWLQVFIILVSIVGIAIVFRPSRFLYVLLIGQAIFFPGIWLMMTLLDKLADFFIEYYISQWARRNSKINPNSNRYTLRARTYSKALRGATSFLSVILGLYISILFFGINPGILASAGVFAVFFAIISRNLIENIINGAIILWNDYYAVGDVVDIDGKNGFVEDMSLYTTSLRNLDGQLIVIPNGKVVIVTNMTKDWSRVNFTIEIAYDADSLRAMQIMQEVAGEMQQDPEWQEKILETPEILGVESVTHQGITIRVLIKTIPLQQWNVGREFRLRLKQALDQAGISIGIPQVELKNATFREQATGNS